MSDTNHSPPRSTGLKVIVCTSIEVVAFVVTAWLADSAGTILAGIAGIAIWVSAAKLRRHWDVP